VELMHSARVTAGEPQDSPPADRLEALERENSELSAFAALAAHELLEPLVAIEGYATLARERLAHDAGSARDSAVEDLAGIIRIAARTRHLVESLLGEVRPDPRPLRVEPVRLADVLTDSLDVLAGQILDQGVRVEIRDLPEIEGDAILLTSLFTNVLANAIKYGPRTGGTIVVESRRGDAEWLISIGSEGAPIPPDDIEAIFEPFRRGDHDRRARGHGLGLAICRRIATRHGGRIGVVPGGLAGNTFLVGLPG
jgi:signal transduction histidine kinase